MTDINKQYRVALFIPSMRGGGAEKAFLLLAKGLIDLGQLVDLVTVSLEGPYVNQIDQRVRVVNLGARRVLQSIPAFVKYLKSSKPEVVISAMLHLNCVAVLVRWISGIDTKLILTEHSSLPSVLKQNINIKDKILLVLSRWLYPLAEKIICVSDGLVKEVSEVIGLQIEKVSRIYNPVGLEDIKRQSKIPPDHPWFNGPKLPVILSVGRLTQPKDFETVLRAYAIVRDVHPARLVILGEGPDRERLEVLAIELGVNQDVSMPGFVSNPYSYMSHCNVFIHSCLHEGFGMVIVEALACGANVVATNCPYGPSEILKDGLFGKLVPVNAPGEMASAIISAIDYPLDSSKSCKRAEDFSIEKISQQYVDIILR